MTTILGAKPYTVTRPGAVTYPDGDPVEAAGTTFVIEASIQPLSGRELTLMPEALRTRAQHEMFTTAELQTGGEGQNPDRVDVNGETFEVWQVHDWTPHLSGAPHYEYLLLAPSGDGL